MALEELVLESQIGKSYPTKEAHAIVSGKSMYACDMELPRMLFGAILRSPHPHARILSIVTERAKELPGVVEVITAEDLPDIRFGMIVQDRYVLAKDRVRFVGEPVAAVAAESLLIAQKALSLIDVKYEVIPAIFDAEEAISDYSSLLVHPEYEKYQKNFRPKDKPNSGTHNVSIPTPKKNVSGFAIVNNGDVEGAFATADFVFENRFTTAKAQCCPMEPHVALARPEIDGGVTIWAESVVPYRLRGEVAQVLQIPSSKVRVVVPMVGGSYGAKVVMDVAHVCAALALKAQRPVKLVLSRREEFLTITRHPFTIYIKDGVKRNGTLVARKIKLIINGGAYSGIGHIITGRSVVAALDVYKIPNILVESYRVYTNLPPGGPFRGVGVPQMLWAVEQQMDIIARALSMNPVEFRMRNILQEGDINGMGERVHNLPIKECLTKVTQMIELDSPRRNFGDWRYGKGVAIGCKSSSIPTVSNAVIVLHANLSVEVRISSVEQGQGIRTVLGQIAAEELGVPYERVEVTTPDTIFTPYDDGSVSSRSTFVAGNAVRAACRDLKEKLLKAGGERLHEFDTKDLEISHDHITVKGRDKSIPLKELFSWGLVEEAGEFTGQATFGLKNSIEPDGSLRLVAYYGAIAQAADVAVNVKTGEIKVLKAATAVDVGRAINKRIIIGQMTGSVAMGLGLTLFEEMNFDGGHSLNTGFLDYRLPTVLDLPERSEVAIFESNQSDGPFGAKGAGEIGSIAIGPAISNAVCNAIGARVTNHPITAKRVLLALDQKSNLATSKIKYPSERQH